MPDTEKRQLDRRTAPSAWQDPRTWVSILGLLLTLCVVVGGYISSQLSALNINVQALNNSMIETRTKQAEQIKTLEDRLHKLEDAQRDQSAYNYDQGKMLTRIQERMNMKEKDNK